MAPNDIWTWRFLGERGEVCVKRNIGPDAPESWKVMLFNADHPEGKNCLEATPAMMSVGFSFGCEMVEFAKLVLLGEEPTLATTTAGLTQPEHSLVELRTAKAVYRSSESRQWEPVFGALCE